MATTIYKKKDFLKWVQENINDEDYVFLTLDMVGHVTANSKRNEKKVSFAFAADAFHSKGDVRDLAFRQTPSFCVAVCGPNFVSDSAKDIYQQGLIARKKKANAKKKKPANKS